VRRNGKNIPGRETVKEKAFSYTGHIVTELTPRAIWKYYYISSFIQRMFNLV
jgi:hypothetical protein